MYVAFTYIIVNKATGKFYYGAKYSKGCCHSDLGTTYFSSSVSLRREIKELGKSSFRYEIRKSFSSVEECLKWEHRVLKRIRAKDRNDCYNLSNGGTTFNASKKMLADNPMMYPASILKMVESKASGRLNGTHASTAMTPEGRDMTARRMSITNPMHNASYIEKMVKTMAERYGGGYTKNSIWIANPYSRERKRVSSSDLLGYLLNGWIKLSNRLPIPILQTT